jgi:hypothetical protein
VRCPPEGATWRRAQQQSGCWTPQRPTARATTPRCRSRRYTSVGRWAREQHESTAAEQPAGTAGAQPASSTSIAARRCEREGTKAWKASATAVSSHPCNPPRHQYWGPTSASAPAAALANDGAHSTPATNSTRPWGTDARSRAAGHACSTSTGTGQGSGGRGAGGNARGGGRICPQQRAWPRRDSRKKCPAMPGYM